jgi:hypothetical protein
MRKHGMLQDADSECYKWNLPSEGDINVKLRCCNAALITYGKTALCKEVTE